jgi:hypothetical protein
MAINVVVDILCNTCCVGELFVGFIDWKHDGDELPWDVQMKMWCSTPSRGVWHKMSHLKTILELLFCALWHIQSPIYNSLGENGT